jgi:hypothetical protein
MHHAEILVCAYVLRQDSDTFFFLLISRTRLFLWGVEFVTPKILTFELRKILKKKQ